MSSVQQAIDMREILGKPWLPAPLSPRDITAIAEIFGQKPKANWSPPQSLAGLSRPSSTHQPRMEKPT